MGTHLSLLKYRQICDAVRLQKPYLEALFPLSSFFLPFQRSVILIQGEKKKRLRSCNDVHAILLISEQIHPGGHTLCVCFTGSFAMLGYKGQAKPSWIKVLNHARYQKAASLQHYVPLKTKEYQCSDNAFSQNHSEHISAGAAAPCD